MTMQPFALNPEHMRLCMLHAQSLYLGEGNLGWAALQLLVSLPPQLHPSWNPLFAAQKKLGVDWGSEL